MSPKSLLLLLLVTVAMVVAAVAVSIPRSAGPDQREGSRLFPALEARVNDVTGITVRSATDRVDLRFDEGVWRLDSRSGYPADFELAKETVFALAQLTIAEPKTADPERYDRLGVGDLDESTPLDSQTFEVILTDSAGTSLAALIVGNRATGTQTSQHYVRPSDAAQSYLVSGPIPSIVSPLTWIDRQPFSIDRARFRRVTVEHADGELISVRSEDGTTWTVDEIPAGQEEIRPNIASPLGSALATPRLDDVTPGDAVDGLEPVALVHAETDNGLWIDARVFQVDGTRWVRFEAGVLSGTDADGARAEADEINQATEAWAYTLSGFQFENLMKRTSDLVQPVESPAAGG